MSIHDYSDHFFPRSSHELGQAAGGALDVARELTKRATDGLFEGASNLYRRSATYEGIEEDLDDGPKMNYSLGVTAVLIAAVLSGLTGVYFEKVLKESASPVSVWTRNIQLAFYSLFPALIFGVIIKDGEDIAKHGFFEGYNSVVWTAIVFQAIGGVLTSLCINYADNIAKNFATSISIIVSFIFSLWFFGFQVSNTVRSSDTRTSPQNACLSERTVCHGHRPCSLFNLALQRARQEARPAATHQHRQLREDRHCLYAQHTFVRKQAAQSDGLGAVYWPVDIQTIHAAEASFERPSCQRQGAGRLDGTMEPIKDTRESGVWAKVSHNA